MLVEDILHLPRTVKRLILVVFDLVVLPFSLWLSFSLRLGEFYFPQGKELEYLYLFIAAPIIAIPIFIKMGLYRAVIRYVGIVALWTIVQAVSLYTLVFGVFVLLSGISGVPRSVILINWLVAILLIGGTRAMARWWLTGSFKPASRQQNRKKVVIYGAGNAGVQMAAAMSNSAAFSPVAFIDDNPALQGNFIEGLRVYPFSRLGSLIESSGVEEVLLALPSVSRSLRSHIISMLEPYPVHVTTVPALDDLASGKVRVDDVREVDVLDLLGRVPVEPDAPLLNANVKNKVVLVTGAGGSIGSELCRQITRIGPKKLVLYERGEHDLYLIENELVELVHRLHPEIETPGELIVPILASILDQGRLASVCKAFEVQTIYHAAAYKHVPMVERNPSEAVRNNVIGTYRAALAAIDSEVETFVLISTDKAVRPTSTMGATKRFAEMILQGLAARESGKTRFTMVRFGNVLDSSGSVVPLFREQILKGGAVTV
ncbi:MAG: polysaccharide biosynthesis protein, partial [Gammaproteobacteria bacterium]|nr:polysaccharide biosynthesis protein [Gammaproteobacteria bacterium]